MFYFTLQFVRRCAIFNATVFNKQNKLGLWIGIISEGKLELTINKLFLNFYYFESNVIITQYFLCLLLLNCKILKNVQFSHFIRKQVYCVDDLHTSSTFTS